MSEIQLPDRALRLVDGAPDVSFLPCDRLLDEGGAEYMRRYYLRGGRGPQRRFHLISADDPGRDWHDHPFDYVTRLLSGAYIEHTPVGSFRYGPGDVLTRKAEQLHRLELEDGPVWTYFVTGRFRRSWGFMTPSGWVPHGQYAVAGRVTGCDSGRSWLCRSRRCRVRCTGRSGSGSRRDSMRAACTCRAGTTQRSKARICRSGVMDGLRTRRARCAGQWSWLMARTPGTGT